MKQTAFRLTLITMLVAAPVFAGAQYLPQLQRLHPDCDIVQKSIKTAKGTIDGQQRHVVLYTVEGCGGGNNWGSAVTAFDTQGKPLGTYNIGEGAVGTTADTVAVRNDKIAVDTLSLGPDDARCCPSVRSTTYLTIHRGKLIRVAK